MSLQTPLFETHKKYGAKIVEFAGYQMPVRYDSQIEEHKAVRQNCGLFDVSHMGEFFFRGAKAQNLLQKLTTNDVSKLSDGQAQYTCMTQKDGGIIDDLIVYRLDEDNFMMVVNAANRQKDWEWVNKHNTEEVEIRDESDKWALLALQGPKANQLANHFTDFDVNEIGFYKFARGRFAQVENAIISGTGYTGSGGLELYVPAADAPALWDTLLSEGEAYGIKPCGLGARETLRLEMAFCLYGNDIDETTTPLEARLKWITKLDTDFIGKEALVKQKEEAIEKRLVGFTFDSRRNIARKGFAIFNEAEEQIGTVTSGSFAPSLGYPIALGYVPPQYAKANKELFVEIRKKKEKATITKLPFYKA